MRLIAALIGTLAIAVAGCGKKGGEPSGAGPDSREERPAPPAEAAADQPPGDADGGGFRGHDAENYDIAKTVCGGFPPRKVASDLGLTVNGDTADELVQIAERYVRIQTEPFVSALECGISASAGVGSRNPLCREVVDTPLFVDAERSRTPDPPSAPSSRLLPGQGS